MSGDVFEVSMVVGPDEDATAELFGVTAGAEFPISDPVEVPAGVLARAAGVSLVDLPGCRFTLSERGWVPVDTRV